MTTDKYDSAEAALHRLAEKHGWGDAVRFKAWLPPHEDSEADEVCAHQLFSCCAPDHTMIRPDGRICGCLTEVRSGSLAYTKELTDAIRADKRIPKHPGDR